MNAKLVERLQALVESAENLLVQARGKNAPKADGLAVAKVLLAVDGAVRKLNKLAEDLKPDLFDGKETA